MISLVLKQFGRTLLCLVTATALAAPAAALEPITPIPGHTDYNQAKALLGRTLFLDPILSADRSVSCASCHDLTHSGADTRPVSLGVKGAAGFMNSPTVFNAVFNFRQFWNGRADDLRTQADGPIHNPTEMRMSKEEVEARLNDQAAYRQRFGSLYGKKRVEYDDVCDAIVEFEKALTTPDSRFDRYLRRQDDLSAEELKGYHSFKELGCVTCHNGVNLGGNSFQRVGVLNPYPWDGKRQDRFTVTNVEFDKNIYKVPTLRNIELTAPYFHDGSKKTLREALKAMAHHNLGFELSEEEEKALLVFLKTLTGKGAEILTIDPDPTWKGGKGA